MIPARYPDPLLVNQPQAIICNSSERIAEAKCLAHKYNLPLLDADQGQVFSGLSLIIGERLQLYNPAMGGPLEINFSSPALISRIRSGRKQPIGRACGLHKSKDLCILDCTAGMGQDMLTLAGIGATVTAIERNEFIHLLLQDAFHRSNLPDFVQQALSKCAEPILADARSYLEQAENGQWDVIYLDPMFSGYKRSALPKKPMQLFSDICGEDSDADSLFKLALTKSVRRVVVKRGHQAPFLTGLKPDHQVKGSRMRFDVYISAN